MACACPFGDANICGVGSWITVASCDCDSANKGWERDPLHPPTLSVKAEKAVGRLPRAMEQGTAHSRGRMGDALCATGGPANGLGSFLASTSTGGPREGSSRGYLPNWNRRFCFL
jgi:hypothetical protein